MLKTLHALCAVHTSSTILLPFVNVFVSIQYVVGGYAHRPVFPSSNIVLKVRAEQMYPVQCCVPSRVDPTYEEGTHTDKLFPVTYCGKFAPDYTNVYYTNVYY